MATYSLIAGADDTVNMFPTLGTDDVVVVPLGSSDDPDADQAIGFETSDQLDVSELGLTDAEALIDLAVPLVGGVRIETLFGSVTIPGVTKGQLSVENFILAGDARPPIAQDDTGAIVSGSTVDIPVLENDSDLNGGTLAISGVTTVTTGGTVSLENNGTAEDSTDDFLRYTPDNDFLGTDSFTYSITNGNFTDTATVTVTVEENIAPTAENDAVIVRENEESVIPLLLNDSDANSGDTIILSVPSTSTNGSTIGIVDNEVLYTPGAGVTSDGFNYTITDAAGATATATVTISVEAEGSPITGGDEEDLLIASDQTETVETIVGGGGDDIIVSGVGQEILTGGDGADKFVYLSLDNVAPDYIQDFDVTADTIVLDFEISGTPVGSSDVQINTDFISFGLAVISLNNNTGVINLNNLDPTTTEEDIRSRIEFGMM